MENKLERERTKDREASEETMEVTMRDHVMPQVKVVAMGTEKTGHIERCSLTLLLVTSASGIFLSRCHSDQ